jgi:hypothetical protein
MITDRDMRDQVLATLDGVAHEYDVAAIVEEIQHRYGTVDVDAVPDAEYWEIVRARELVNPCAEGCTDPTAHAEGAHDV